MKTLLLSTVNETLFINTDTIIRVEASSNYSKIYRQGETFPVVVAKALCWFEKRLPQEFFSRIHRTHIINKKFLVKVWSNNAVLQSGEQISISRRKKKQWLSNFGSGY
jgi:two-component system LytT family response regulator